MRTINELLLAALSLLAIISYAQGGSYHHVHHRIHVPQKIKTIYHTKIIKVPEHHHHFHEKEKIIIEKEKPKNEHHTITVIKGDDHNDWDSGLESSNYYKKKRNAQHPHQSNKGHKSKKRRLAQRHSYDNRRS
ncbi:hypothetical protein ABEB36_001652 [Hypothenemus hampei]|uniref:Uncharacterized protein n=1 Tax=Hypothenemus hampei TaxID=57062 RepID=A0ABD1FF94_HYPHA